MQALIESSIRTILANQNAAGAYIASPNFRDYRYCWLRDGSFIAYAMLRAGQAESTASFLRWCGAVIRRHAEKIARLERCFASGGTPAGRDFLPARYTMEGFESADDWPLFQVDGYGAWLWCLAEYLGRTNDGALLGQLAESVSLTLRYLRLVWHLPCYDCWEENGDKVHPASLACVSGGLTAISPWLKREDPQALAGQIKGYILSHLTADGRLPKYVGSESIDASLLWVSTPFAVLAPEEPVMRKTTREIETCLLEKGGVKRYPEDTYFGGGQWILLSCWLAWHYARAGEAAKARELLSWVEARADANAHLAEQDLSITNDPRFITQWEQKSGTVARPLLWSHAMYLVAREQCA